MNSKEYRLNRLETTKLVGQIGLKTPIVVCGGVAKNLGGYVCT